jgi:hypothetical protein
MFLVAMVIVSLGLGIERLMVIDDPASLDLRGLFRDPDMFDSRSSLTAAGFKVLNKSSNGKIMVSCHPSVRGLLFKKYTAAVSHKDQRKNYECRLEGSRRLRAFVVGRGLTRVIVPRKWIVELPREVSRRDTLLVVEQLELLGSEQTVSAYQRIDAGLLKELCTVLFHFRGMDSNANNLPFLTGDRIGLVDTEHWNRGTRKDYLHHVGEHMAAESRKIAKAIFRELREGDSLDDSDTVAADSDSLADDDDDDDSSSSSSSFSSSS